MPISERSPAAIDPHPSLSHRSPRHPSSPLGRNLGLELDFAVLVAHAENQAVRIAQDLYLAEAPTNRLGLEQAETLAVGPVSPFAELARSLEGGGVVVQRHCPPALADRLRQRRDIAVRLHRKDKAFFYRDLVIEEVV